MSIFNGYDWEKRLMEIHQLYDNDLGASEEQKEKGRTLMEKLMVVMEEMCEMSEGFGVPQENIIEYVQLALEKYKQESSKKVSDTA